MRLAMPEHHAVTEKCIERYEQKANIPRPKQRDVFKGFCDLHSLERCRHMPTSIILALI